MIQSTGPRNQGIDLTVSSEPDSSQGNAEEILSATGKRTHEDFASPSRELEFPASPGDPKFNWRSRIRQTVYNGLRGESSSFEWEGLLSSSNNHAQLEEELGET